MGLFSSSSSKKTTVNEDNRIINDMSGSTFDQSSDSSQHYSDSSYKDNSVFNSSSDYTDNSTFTSSSDYIDNSAFTDSSNRSYNDNSVFTDQSDNSFTDNSVFTSDSSYKDNSVTNYLDGGAIAAGRDVSVSALQMVENSSARLVDAFKSFSFSNEQATDSALKVASGIANTAGGNVGISDANVKVIGFVAVGLGLLAFIGKKYA